MHAVDLAHSKPSLRQVWALFGVYFLFFMVFFVTHSDFLYRPKYDFEVQNV